MMRNCFYGMVDQWKVSTLFPARIIARDPHHFQSDKLQAGFEPAQDLSSGLVEWSCAVVIITTPRYYCMIVFSIIFLCIVSLMQSVNGAQFLNITFLFLLFGAVAVAIAVFGFVIVPLTCMHHCNHINSTFALRFYAQFDTWVIIVYLLFYFKLSLNYSA